MPLVSIVIPCRNESVRLPATLDSLREYMGARDWEVVVVIEKGSDNTAELVAQVAAEDPRIRGIANPVARGKGYAVKTGMLAATGEIVFFMDADMSVPLKFVDAFLPDFEKGADVVFGSRQHPESVIVRSQPLQRVLAGRGFNLCLRMCGATRFHDTQCGFKAFRKNAARMIFQNLTVEGFGFDVEALALAEVAGLKIVERPVDWCDAPGSKVRALRDGFSAFAEAVRGARRARVFRNGARETRENSKV